MARWSALSARICGSGVGPRSAFWREVPAGFHPTVSSCDFAVGYRFVRVRVGYGYRGAMVILVPVAKIERLRITLRV